MEITTYSMSDFNRIKLDLYNKRNCRKYSNICRLKITLLHDSEVIKEMIKEIKNSWKLIKLKTKPFRTYDI
jgi:hypothetical protein